MCLSWYTLGNLSRFVVAEAQKSLCSVWCFLVQGRRGQKDPRKYRCTHVCEHGSS